MLKKIWAYQSLDLTSLNQSIVLVRCEEKDTYCTSTKVIEKLEGITWKTCQFVCEVVENCVVWDWYGSSYNQSEVSKTNKENICLLKGEETDKKVAAFTFSGKKGCLRISGEEFCFEKN